VNHDKSKMLCIRCSSMLRSRFYRTAKKIGNPSDVLRDLMQAFVEGRVTVTPDPKKPTLENPHVD